jgi:hypothetical protein
LLEFGAQGELIRRPEKLRREIMASKGKPFPEGFHSITPYLVVKSAAAAIDFYKAALRLKELNHEPSELQARRFS